MIKNFLITGDTHGRVLLRLLYIDTKYNPAETALIILGDAGLNYYINERDRKEKTRVEASGYTVYCVRGNHEMRPINVPNMIFEIDKEIDGPVFYEKEFPHIRYLMDGVDYQFDKYRALVIGGAYSVDKYHRLAHDWSWFENEQLNENEMRIISREVKDKNVDFVLTHTCPYGWMPRDLFLSIVNQTQVDNSMELWLDELKDIFNWKVWCFGHYHADRIQRPRVELFYGHIDNIDDIYNRWFDKHTIDTDINLDFSPYYSFYADEEGEKE